MSVLSDKGIYEAIEKNYFSITPLIANNVQPGSIDLTLYHELEAFSCSGVFDPQIEKEEIKKCVQIIDISDAPYELAPNAFVTGYSAEVIKLSTFLGGRIYNRNSLVKCGIDASLSSFANPGYEGRKIIVIHNIGPTPVLLHAGMRICQLELHLLESQSVRGYHNRHKVDDLIPEIEARLKGRELTYTTNYKDASLSEFMEQRINEVVRGK